MRAWVCVGVGVCVCVCLSVCLSVCVRVCVHVICVTTQGYEMFVITAEHIHG